MYLHLFRKKYILDGAILGLNTMFSSEMSIQRGVYTNRQKSWTFFDNMVEIWLLYDYNDD